LRSAQHGKYISLVLKTPREPLVTAHFADQARARTQETLKRDGRAKRQAASYKLEKKI
jgi:hypothetical protein